MSKIENTGKLKISKHGFGVIITEDINRKIRVGKKDLNHNFSGDVVTFTIIKSHEKIEFAKITSEPKYKDREFVGIIHHTFRINIFIYNLSMGKNNLVVCDTIIVNGYVYTNENNFVKFKIVKYEDGLFYGVVIENYGIFNDNIGLTKYLINFYNLKNEFDEKVIKNIDEIITRFNNDKVYELENRKDLRNIKTFTIDPEGSRDLDDAISLIKIRNGYKLYIHIADVSYFVKKDSEVDKEALRRCFSVYLPNQVIRMLPAVLSENLCSLLPDSDKYAVTTEVDVDMSGEVLHWKIYKSVIRSNVKFSYKEVYNILETNTDCDYIEDLKLLYELSKILEKDRLKLPIKKLNKNFEMDISYSDYSHSMIEEMMILNNILAAKTLSKSGLSYPSRYHNSPEYGNNINMMEFMEKINGIPMTELNVTKLQNLVNTKDNKTQLINLLFIQRILQKAKYEHNDQGHWALNLEYYSHFTSPIRRYSDLIAHRLIFENNCIVETLKKNLDQINRKEEDYQKIEFLIDKVKLIRQLNNNFVTNKEKILDGYITDIRNPTISIFIPSIFWSQEFHIAQLSTERMKYDNIKKYFYDENDNKIISGMSVKLKLTKVKVSYMELDFEIIKNI